MGNKLTNDDFKLALNEIGERAVIASRRLAIMSHQEKDRCLAAMAETIVREKDYILRENQRDLENGVANGMSQAMLDRLRLNDARVAAMAEGILQVVRLEDPVGKIFSTPVAILADGDKTPDIVVGSMDRNIYCINGLNGLILWKKATEGEVVASVA